MTHPTLPEKLLRPIEPRSTRGRLRKSRWALPLALSSIALFASCGATENGATNTGGASSGGASSGGASSGGASSGGTNQSGGSQSSSLTGGRETTGGAGSGGAVATGGRDPSLGGAGAGSGGMGGEAAGGKGGSLVGDPACHCVFEDSWFECTLPLELLAQRLPEPSSCDEDLDYVRHTGCADGSTQHVWLEGSENDYTLARDPQGNVIYVHALGYVGRLCEIESTEFEVGAITAGTRPMPSSCETCTVCTSFGGAGGGFSQPEACP